MTSGNSITIVGNLGSDPELRFTDSGVPVATITVGVSERKRNTQSGEWEDTPPTWFRVIAWNQLAEHIAESLNRGDRVMVTGPMRQRSWENRDNETQYIWEITAEHVGVSLQFASVSVKRAARGRPASEPASPAASEPGPDAAPADASGPRHRRARNSAAPATA